MSTLAPPNPCPRCAGSRVDSLSWGGGATWRPNPCTACCCQVCGQPTDTPPECQDCAIRADAAAVRRADV